MAETTPSDLAYEHAKLNLGGQRARLDNLRARSAAVITAASVVASFLGGQALSDTKTVPGSTAPVADRTLQLWEGVAFGAFLLLLLANAWIIRPKTKGWTFRLNARRLLEDADAKSRDEELALRRAGASDAVPDPSAIAECQKRELAEHMEDYYARNEPKIEKLFSLLQLSVVLLAVEATAFLIDLVT